MIDEQHISRKTLERQARQQFVVDAARRLIASQSIELIRMEDIADAADYTRRTLYAYFKSRDDILLLAFAEDLARRREQQNGRIAALDSGLAKLLAWGKVYYGYVQANPHSRRLQRYWDYTGIEQSRFSEETLEQFEKINEALAEDLRGIFLLGINDGSLRSDLNIDMTISHFLYSLRAILDRAQSSTYSFANFDSEEYVEQFLELLGRAVRKQDGEEP